MDESGVEMLKEIPGFKAILKAVLKQQMQMLVQQLSDHVGEEAVLLTCSLSDCSLGHLGSDTGKTFVEENLQIKSQFLDYCLNKRRRKPSEGNNNPQGPSGPVASNAQPTPHPNHPTLQYNQKTTSLVKRHSYTIKRPTPYSKLCNRSKRQNNTDGTAVESVDTHSGFRNEHQNDFSEMTKLNRDSEKLLNEPTKDSEQMVNMNYVGVGLISSGVNDIPQPDVNIGSTNDGTGPTNAIKDSKTIVAGENNPNLSSDNSFTTVKVKREDGISEGFDDVGNACLGISAVTANNSLVTADYSLGTADYSLMTADANPRFEDNKSTLEETASELTNQEALELTGEEPADGTTADGKFRTILVRLDQKKQRRILSLEERVNALKLMSSGLSARKTALSLGVGKSQIQEVFKRREEIMADWLSGNVNPDRKRKSRKTENDEINAMCLNWYNEAVASGFPVSGPALQQKALELAVQLGVPSFKASNGWLESFRKRYKVVTCGQKPGDSSGEKDIKDHIDRAITEINMYTGERGITQADHCINTPI